MPRWVVLWNILTSFSCAREACFWRVSAFQEWKISPKFSNRSFAESPSGHGCWHWNAWVSRISRAWPEFLTIDACPNDPGMSTGYFSVFHCWTSKAHRHHLAMDRACFKHCVSSDDRQRENTLSGADVHDFRRGRPGPEVFWKNFVQKKVCCSFGPFSSVEPKCKIVAVLLGWAPTYESYT